MVAGLPDFLRCREPVTVTVTMSRSHRDRCRPLFVFCSVNAIPLLPLNILRNLRGRSIACIVCDVLSLLERKAQNSISIAMLKSTHVVLG